MALECTLVFETEPPVFFTCADGTGIPKGSVLKLTDPNTVVITAGDTDPVAGIAAEEKIASDGKKTIAVYQRGTFKGYAGAAGVTAGMAIITDTGTGAANELVVADVNSEHLVGTAKETATDGETFLFDLLPRGVQLA